MKLSILIGALAFVFIFGAPSKLAADGVCASDTEDAFRKIVGWHDSRYGRLRLSRNLSHNPASLEDAREFDSFVSQYLSRVPRSALIAYAAEQTGLCVFLWTENGGKVYVKLRGQTRRLLELSKELADALDVTSTWKSRAARNLVVAQAQPPVFAGNQASIIDELSRLIFPPELRAHLTGVEQISIVPVMGMSALPFALLRPFGDERTTADVFPVNILESLLSVRAAPIFWPKKYSDPLIVGNPRPSQDQEYHFSNLPGAEREANEAQTVLGGRKLLRDAAIKEAVMKLMEDSQLIYFSSHGFSAPKNALQESFLMLADGRLTAQEVQGMKFRNNPLVVLSACQTGEGEILEGGVIGIARGFQLAGAANTVMSLWAVDDVITAELMGYFVRRLGSQPPSSALQASVLELRKKYPNPAHWAAFNVFGPHGRIAQN